MRLCRILFFGHKFRKLKNVENKKDIKEGDAKYL